MFAAAVRRRRNDPGWKADEQAAFGLLTLLDTLPVRVRERDSVRAALFAKEIYPPVHWAIEGVVPTDFKASHRLAENNETS